MSRRPAAHPAGPVRHRMLSAGFVVAVVLLLVGATTAATVLVLRAPRPAALADATPLETVPVEPYAFADPRTVRVDVTTGEPQPLVTQASGTVTATACVAGGALVSGERVVEVDGAPVVGLTTAVPLWRDLASGDKGEDVRAVQDELTRLGLSPGTSGRVDRATAAALRTFAKDRGITLTTGGPLLPLASVVWLPEASVEVASCGAVLGVAVAAGDEVALLGAPVVGAVATVPAGLVPGARTLTVDGVTIAVAEDGTVAEPASLAGTESYLAALAAEEAVLSGTLQLAEPLEVIAVPTAAVHGEDASGAGCVRADGAERAVQVVSSELGQSLVTLTGEVPSQVEVGTDRDVSCGSS
jgi:peptidoglycan hydrolase-like protein with peptidoglycan-binding domain